MIRRVLVASLVAPWVLAAQMQLFVVRQGVESVVGQGYNVGNACAGETLDTTFRVRNTSTSTVWLSGLNVAGTAFQFAPGGLPTLPLPLAPGVAASFVVRFQPGGPGTYSAYLNVNGVRIATLAGTASNVVSLIHVSSTVRTPLTSGDTVDFGPVERGTSASQGFELQNTTQEILTVSRLAIDGTSFSGPSGLTAPLAVEPGASVPFEVSFAPVEDGPAEGSLQVDGRAVTLRGSGKEPEPPRPSIEPETQILRGGQQVKIVVRLASVSRTAAGGELSIDFQPDVPGKSNDPALQFPASGGRSIGFTIAEGEDAARFGNLAYTELQTGTTAGTIVLRARLGSHGEELTLIVPEAPPVVDSAASTRVSAGIDVQVTGFDTARSTAALTFIFYDRSGRTVAPGAIQVDATQAFQHYFATTDLGGMFVLHALFPVRGNVASIGSVDVEIRNSLGPTRTARVQIE